MPRRFGYLIPGRFLPALAAILLTSCASLDHEDRRVIADHGVSPALYDKMCNQESLTLNDIIELSQKQVPSAFILNYLTDLRIIYRLTTKEVIELQTAGVSPDVINYLLRTRFYYGPHRNPYQPAYLPSAFDPPYGPRY